MRHALDAARDLERAFDQLMRLLDARAADPGALEQAASACDAGFEALRAGFELDEGASRTELARTLRSNAIALDLAGRRLTDVRERIERVRTIRQALARQPDPAAASGGACDVAG